MKESCPYLQKCPIFEHFRKYAQIVFQEFYCLGDYEESCNRYKLRQTGATVPVEMMPYDALPKQPRIRS